MRSEQEVLEEINRALPRGVDWKRGALTYVSELVARGGPAFRHWHLTKPFLGEPLVGEPLHGDAERPAVDPHVTYHELYGFLNVMRAADLPVGARVLDVGCGPGWTSHYLGKMGYRVLGFDLCEEMLDLARERVGAEPFPPRGPAGLEVRFVAHDIEAAPLGARGEGLFDLALLDSVLHHFEDPIAALRNVGESLRPGAVVAIIEAFHPEGAPADPHNLAIMERYHTLERPYTRRQLSEVLRLAGFPHHVCLDGVNGLFAAHELEHPIASGPTSAVLAAREGRSLGRFGSGQLAYLGFHGEEQGEEGPFRWARPASGLVLDGREHVLHFKSLAAGLGRSQHDVFVSIDGALVATLRLVEAGGEAVFRPGPVPAGTRLAFHSDFSFSPKLLGMSPDDRVLAFQLRVVPA